MICWDFKSEYKSLWIFELLIVWHIDNFGKLNLLHIGNLIHYDNLEDRLK